MITHAKKNHKKRKKIFWSGFWIGFPKATKERLKKEICVNPESAGNESPVRRRKSIKHRRVIYECKDKRAVTED